MSCPERKDLIETMRSHRICVLIPTYNNAGTVGDVISRVLEYSSDVIVVNDGSTDNTSEILKSFGDDITVVSYPANAGKGSALKRGFRKAIGMGYEYAITIDSDGQHYPEDIPCFVKAIVENPGSLIVGERDLSNVDINGKSSFANKFSNFWFHVQTGRNLKDTQTGFRAYPLKKLHGLSILTSRYEAELELLVFASWHGVRILSIPIQVYYPPQSERVSHFKPALDFTRISILNTILCVAAIAYGLPLRIRNSLTQRRIFGKEVKAFTYRRGKRLDAAITLGRIIRSIFGFSFFGFWATGVLTPFAIIYFSIGKDSERKRTRFHKMLKSATRVLVKTYPGAKTIYENLGNETFDTPAIVICNHQSHLDLPVLMSVSHKFIFLTNDWVWDSRIFGKIVHNAEFMPVSQGMETILPQLRNLRDRGYSIVVFPEGTRSADCSIMRFHQGAFLLARELDLDIVPMTLHGAGHYLPKKSFCFRKGRITLRTLGRHSIDPALPLRANASNFRKLIRREYDLMAQSIETAAYFRSLVLYKYAWRGWDTVARCRKILRKSRAFDHIINSGKDLRKVRILNSGIGVFPLLYALVNEKTEVFAFESDIRDFNTAANTAGIPENLHYSHAVWNSETGNAEDFDLTIVLGSSVKDIDRDGNIIHIPLKS